MLRREPEVIEIELIRSLFEAFVPSVIMTVGFIVCGALIVGVTQDRTLVWLLVVGALLSAPRLGIAWFGGREARRPDLSLLAARRLEWRLGTSYAIFALVMGLFGARTMQLPFQHVHMLIICLVMGYCAGIAVCAGLRPVIAICCMVLAMVPPAIIAVTRGDALYWATSAMMLAFLGGGLQSLLTRYRRSVFNTARRLTLATLARTDGLTDLPNRLGLREWFDEHVVLAKDRGLVAVHCLDLNGFKPVNDTHGHPTGDALLTVVAQRLSHMTRGNDIAARLGGDEFVVVQCIVYGAEEADALARRIAGALAQPYLLGELEVRISASVGYVVGHGDVDDLDTLLSRGDEALYNSKRRARGVTRYAPVSLVSERLAS